MKDMTVDTIIMTMMVVLITIGAGVLSDVGLYRTAAACLAVDIFLIGMIAWVNGAFE